ncbi:hypothetical protein GUITHDRAFT_148796 [Guillardia theta CCMP2712]|uniref:Uncharacterized protein n=1 Tax=Guillardia theta (strain CCMP2712) TaxID=905079 RepID=L1I8G8_GUITC|nr:hypothetical protein GUITHDRAFT_148796 [Guillardia theta CCMP2712]EKX32189.1 hypothetical protein GUITHDRAFT_148796 [Guillardia theta CCMP2712]|eukprot:XP_005819169.1 hypothetical protein GUITHDRAFT_148796 [Guillardia theta CCMP2712]
MCTGDPCLLLLLLFLLLLIPNPNPNPHPLLCWKAESLLLAIRTENVQLVSRYVKSGKDCNFYTGVFPPLTIAAGEGRGEMVKLLLQGRADVNHAVLPCWWFEVRQNLSIRILTRCQGNVEVARALLEAKLKQADVDARTLKGNTPLLFAANSGHLECAKVAGRKGGKIVLRDLAAASSAWCLC